MCVGIYSIKYSDFLSIFTPVSQPPAAYFKLIRSQGWLRHRLKPPGCAALSIHYQYGILAVGHNQEKSMSFQKRENSLITCLVHISIINRKAA